MPKTHWQRFVKWLAEHVFQPSVSVGNKERVKKEEDVDPEEKRLAELNKTWRQMLREDPWMIKLMTHVRLLVTASGIFFLTLFFCGLYLPAKSPVFSYILSFSFATIPYWLWVGKWHARIEEKVFKEFKKRFGKFFHLR